MPSSLTRAGVTRYRYDRRGNLTHETQTTNGATTTTIEYAHDVSDRLIAMAYPSGRVVCYHYNRAGQMVRVDTTQAGGHAQPGARGALLTLWSDDPADLWQWLAQLPRSPMWRARDAANGFDMMGCTA